MSVSLTYDEFIKRWHDRRDQIKFPSEDEMRKKFKDLPPITKLKHDAIITDLSPFRGEYFAEYVFRLLDVVYND